MSQVSDGRTRTVLHRLAADAVSRTAWVGVRYGRRLAGILRVRDGHSAWYEAGFDGDGASEARAEQTGEGLPAQRTDAQAPGRGVDRPMSATPLHPLTRAHGFTLAATGTSHATDTWILTGPRGSIHLAVARGRPPRVEVHTAWARPGQAHRGSSRCPHLPGQTCHGWTVPDGVAMAAAAAVEAGGDEGAWQALRGVYDTLPEGWVEESPWGRRAEAAGAR